MLHWYFEIVCTAALLVCATNTPPDVRRDYPSHIECDKALMSLAQRWHPHGAWKMNCVQRR